MRVGYTALIADEETHRAMVYWVAEACREAREDAERGQVSIAASLGGRTVQSTIDRFEKHDSQPKNIDATVMAYADDLDVDPRQLWARALQLWINAEQPSTDLAARAVQHVRAAARGPAKSQTRSPAKRPAKKKRAA